MQPRKNRTGPVLLVEDDPFIRRDVAELLGEEGYDVVSAGDGCEALSIMRDGPLPALVLLDLTTPTLDGWEFRQQQLDDCRLAAVPVVLLSGADNLVEVSRTLHAAGYLTKPYGVNELLTVVAKHCAAAH